MSTGVDNGAERVKTLVKVQKSNGVCMPPDPPSRLGAFGPLDKGPCGDSGVQFFTHLLFLYNKDCIKVFQSAAGNTGVVRMISCLVNVDSSEMVIPMLYSPGQSGGKSGHYDVLHMDGEARSLNVNDFVLVKYDTVSIPAVVVRGGNGLAVRYFDRDTTGKLYAAQEFEYEVLPEDIIKNLAAPTMEPRGSRIYYIFSDI